VYLSNPIAPYRDVNLVALDDNCYLAIACDSCGGVGEKERDIVRVPPYIVGRFTTRVTLMEILSVGASPKALTAAICNEPEPTGEGMLMGIKDELKALYFDLPLIISTEKNMKTCQTGLGITIVGLVGKNRLHINKTKAGDKLYCVGMPKVGNEVSLDDTQIATSSLINELLQIPGIHDIIPIGSKGIKAEADMLVSFLGLKLNWNKNLPIDIKKTAGPATCVLVTCPTELKISMPQPVFLLATVK
jgi:hypothetical protein